MITKTWKSKFQKDSSDSDERPFFLVKVPTVIDNDELEEIPANHHTDLLNKGK